MDPSRAEIGHSRAPAPRAARARPDPTTVRAAFAAGGIAGLSAILAAVIAPVARPAAAVIPPAPATPATVQQPVRYVQLQPGESAPPGATVIDAQAPKPITIVTTVPAPSQRPVIIRTTQSGKRLP